MKITVNSKPKIASAVVETKSKVNQILINKVTNDITNLDDLVDVSILSPDDGDVLTFDGTLWKAQQPQSTSTTVDGGTFS